MRTTLDSSGRASYYQEKNSTQECFSPFDDDSSEQPEMMILTLEDQANGYLVDFDLIDEEDLPFLNKQTEIGLQLRRCVIESSMDDDVMTDDELELGAKSMLMQSLREAV